MKRKGMTRSTRELLKRWGVSICDRPDYWDGRNRTMMIIIDETVDDDAVIFENGVTYRMNSESVDSFIDEFLNQMCEKLVVALIDAINAYAKWNICQIRTQVGSKWLKDAWNRVKFFLGMYGLNPGEKYFSYLDWKQCCKYFGSERNFRQLIRDAVAYNSDELCSKCITCANCHCDKDGVRYCDAVMVPVDEFGERVKTLRRITEDQPISNLLEDIIPTFSQREECSHYVKNDTTFIDAIIVLRNKWLRDEQGGTTDGDSV